MTGGGIDTGHIEQPVTEILAIASVDTPLREDSLRSRYLSFEPIFDADANLRAYELVLKGRLAPVDDTSELARMDEDMLLTGLYSLLEDRLSGEFPLLVRISELVLHSDIPLQINRPSLIWATPVNSSAASMRARTLQRAGLAVCPIVAQAGVRRREDWSHWRYLQLAATTPPIAPLPGVRLVVTDVAARETLAQWPRDSWFKGALFTGETSTGPGGNEHQRRLDLLAIALRQPLDTLIQFFRLNPDMAPRLIALATSPIGGLSRVPDSATHALVLLGRQRAQRVAAILALAGCKPDPTRFALAKTAFVRALFMGKLVRLAASPEEASMAFEVGLYSTAAEAFGQGTGTLTIKLGLSGRMAAALAGQACAENTLLRLARACETGTSDTMVALAHALGVGLDDIAAAYLDAVLSGEALDAAFA